jgi:hypothetical protein
LAAGAVVAHSNPADAYEVSLYGATPNGYWIGLAVAALAAVVVTVYAYDWWLGNAALYLGGLGTVSLAAIPIVRGYRFHGLSDALTHLGWAKAIWAGDLLPSNIIYPGSHSFSILFASVSGVPITHAMMVVVVVFLTVFLLSVPATVRTITDSRAAVAAAALSAMLILPVNNVSTHLRYFPFSLASFFSVFVLFLLFKHVTRRAEDSSLPARLSAASLVVPLASAALLIFHPMLTLDFLVLLGTATTVQLAYRRYAPSHLFSSMRGLYGQFAVLTVLFLVWNLWIEPGGLMTHSQSLQREVIAFFSGQSQAGQTIAQQQDSVSAVGSSLPLLFLKLFAVSAVYALVAVAYGLGKISGKINEASPSGMVGVYFGFAGFAMLPILVVSFIGEVSNYFFRHLGYGMVLVTVLVPIALYDVFGDRLRLSKVNLKPIAAVVVVVMLAMSLAVAFPSPYIYKKSQHVSEYQMDGFATAFDQQDREVEFVGVQSLAGRFSDALYFEPNPNLPLYSEPSSVPEAALLAQNVTSHYEKDHYLTITTTDYQRSVVAYDELQYSAESFRSTRSHPGLHRVQTNGNFRLYYVDTSWSNATTQTGK